MRIWPLAFLFSSTFAQTIALQGQVLTKTGSPIEKAIVSLAGQGLLDTTNASGAFAFESALTSIRETAYSAPQINWQKGNLLSINVSKSSLLQVNVFDALGKLLYQQKLQNFTGTRTFDIGCKGANGIRIVNASVNGYASSFIISSDGSVHEASLFKSKSGTVLKKETDVSSLVSFYGDTDYGNLSASLDTGSYTTAELVSLGIKDNDISSMKIPAGLTVELYDLDNFGTLLGTYTTDESNFISLGINDKVSSIKISGAAYIDSLVFTAEGFKSKAVPISSYEGNMLVSLDSANSTASTGSVGCGKALGSIKTGYYTIISGGTTRNYAIDIPANYDPDKPYRLIYCSHWIYANDSALVNGSVTNGGAANWAFYGLKRVLDSAGVQAIFIAPTALNGMWGQVDHALFDNLLSYAKTNLCVDTTRVFAAGFSFGAMQTYSLSTNHQKQLRAVATLAAANYNIWLPTNTHEKIPYLGITGMSDGTCPFIKSSASSQGGFYAATGHATDNGCTVPGSITTTYAGSKTHVVYDFKDCDSGYPVRYITFDGAHIAAPTDGQTSDDGRKTWAPHEIWKFFSQF
jgi:hypothetical protein